jgi:hypothetical protein
MTKQSLATIGTGLVSVTAVSGAEEIAKITTEVLSTPDYSQVLQIVLQILVSVGTLIKLFKTDKKKEDKNVDRQ